MSDWFVGFRPMLKRPGGTEAHKVSHVVEVGLPVSAMFTQLTSREGIDALLDETVRFDARQGGKLRFISAGDDGYGGTYSRIQVGRRVILLTERHGELDFRLKEKGSSTEVTLRASRLSTPEETAQWRDYVDAIASRLARRGGPS
jgi:hypothetical protein